MTRQQILNKISELSDWLSHNPNHPNHATVANDKRDLERQLAEHEKLQDERRR